LRKQSVVTVAYCNTDAMMEPDFLEGIRFAAQHQLPVVFICEQDSGHTSQEEPPDLRESSSPPSSTTTPRTLPEGITYHCIDGGDIVEVYLATQTAMQQAREGTRIGEKSGEGLVENAFATDREQRFSRGIDILHV